MQAQTTPVKLPVGVHPMRTGLTLQARVCTGIWHGILAAPAAALPAQAAARLHPAALRPAQAVAVHLRPAVLHPVPAAVVLLPPARLHQAPVAVA